MDHNHPMKQRITRIIRLDGARMTDRSATHRYLREALDFPDYYGNNLDALYDLLTEPNAPLRIILSDTAALLEHQPDYGQALLQVLEDCDTANPDLRVEFREGPQSDRSYRVSLK